MNGTLNYPNWLKTFPPEPAPDAHGPRRAPKRKKKPGKKATNNRNVGKLAGILKMPLDVFYEIVSYMHPSDLLRISRVSKHLRSMLMTRNAVSFWRAARKNIGMPDPPPDLNDAQYVALIFEHVCNACGARVEWCKILSLKVQLCKKCNWQNIEGADGVFRHLGASMEGFDWSLVLLVEDLLVHDWKDNATYMARRSLHPEKIAYAPQVKSVIGRLSALEGEAREAYVEQQRRMVQDTLDFIRKYNAWEMKRQAERLSEEARRKEIVYERMEALGHDRRDMKWDDNNDWGKLFTEGGEINETYWRRTLLPSLEREIANWKGSRMVDELCERLALRYAEFMMLLNEFLPEYSDMNPVHPPRMHWRQPVSLFELLRRDDARIPVTRAFLEEHRNVILDVVAEYNCNLRADLIQMAFEDPLGPAKPIAITEEKALEILKSASTLFVKRDRYSELRLSKLYTYGGLIEEIRRDFRYDELDVRLRYGGYDSYGWTETLLEKLGLDEDATWDVVEAKQAEKPLVCLCGKPSFKQPASFINLLSHVLEESDWHFENIHPTAPHIDHDHNTIDLSKLKKLIVQVDAEKGLPLDALLEKYKQKLIKRTKSSGVPDFIIIPDRGFKCLDCRPNGVVMNADTFQWHCLTKHLKYVESRG